MSWSSDYYPPSQSQFPVEKTVREAATAKNIQENTDIPGAQLLFFSHKSDLGSFIILQHVENGPTMSHPRDPSQNMNNMLQLPNIPRAILPPRKGSYSTTNEWYTVLSEQLHMAQLIFQHSDLRTSEDDCRNKYVLRQVFHQLAKEGKLSMFGFVENGWSAQSKSYSLAVSPVPDGSQDFRLWCDDLRDGNMLVNDDNDTVAVTTGNSQTWLSTMKEVEKHTRPHSMEIPLSTYRRESWETGRFWLNYAARKSSAFDTIYWKYLDERFFGKRREDVPKCDL